MSSRREPDGRVPNDQEATLERARAEGRVMLANGERVVRICRSRTRAPGGWGAEIVRYFPIGEQIYAACGGSVSVVEELRL